jgi:hypothetical protein
MDAITLARTPLVVGDLVVSVSDKPESTTGVLLALWGGLLLTSFSKKGPRPCRLTRISRRGLQGVYSEDLLLDKSRDWEVYRLTATEHFTEAEEKSLEEIVHRMLRGDLWQAVRMNAVTAIALLLMRFGKLPRKTPDGYCASSLVSELVGLRIYEHVRIPPEEADILPFPKAA